MKHLLKQIKRAKKQRTSTLYFIDQDLSHLPVEFWQLFHVKDLCCHNNQLKTLSDNISYLISLKSLTICSNQLTDCPKLDNLKSLYCLYLNNNQFKQFPSTLLTLKHLQILALNNNAISVLPSDIIKMSGLRYLYLSNTQLTTIPLELTQLPELAVLDLSYNQITDVLPELANLKNLRVLDLRNNPCILPDRMGELHKQGAGIYVPDCFNLPEELLNESSGMIDRFITGW